MERKRNGALQQWLFNLIFVVIVLRSESVSYVWFTPVNITILHSAVAKGAVCLDGSPPAYHLHRGSGAGINNWLVHLEGGGWCNNVTSCLLRTKLPYGSSNLMDRQFNFTGILSNKKHLNPYFFNWNRVRIKYCDGSSFTGDIEEVDPSTKLFHRGARIFRAVIEDLLQQGMKSARNALLSGCSAGGLASILHCDSFKSLLPTCTKVKCLADAGFFLNAKNIAGQQLIQEYFNDVVTTHGSAKNLPKSCTSEMNPGLCIFPENVVGDIQTPLFIVNSEIDSWQIGYVLIPGDVDPSGSWDNCKANLTNCSTTQLQTIKAYGEDFVSRVNGLGASTSRGYFINSCYTHCQTQFQDIWFTDNSPKLGNKRVAEAVGDWFFDRSPFQNIDCSYPCDKSCNYTVYNPLDFPLL